MTATGSTTRGPSAGWAASLRSAVQVPVVLAAERAPADLLSRLQQRRLRALLRSAITHVPRYRGLLSRREVDVFTARDLAGLPLLSKVEVQSAVEGGLLDDHVDAQALHTFWTSGSSGTKVAVHAAEADLVHIRAGYVADLVASGLRPTDRIAYCRVGAFASHPLERWGVGSSAHIRTTMPLDDQVDALLAARPTFLVGFPNVLLSMAEELGRRGIRPHGVRNVLLGGEAATTQARRVLSSTFGAGLHEVYASVETSTIARSCSLGRLHLLRGDVVVEVLGDDGGVSLEEGTGEILVTSLRNRTMPLIRYRLGDRVRIASSTCPCRSYDTPVVEAVVGRVEDRLLTADGRLVHGDHIIRAAAVPGVVRCQLRQVRPGAADLLVEAGPDGGPELAAAVQAALTPDPALVVTARLVEGIATDGNGKHRLVLVRIGAPE